MKTRSLVTGALLSLIVASTAAVFGQHDQSSEKITTALNGLYAGYKVSLDLHSSHALIVCYQPVGASDEQLLERAVNYARTFFMESELTHVSIKLLDQNSKNKWVEISLSLSDLKNMANGTSYRPTVHHKEIDARVADGPMQKDRADLLKRIDALKKAGADVTECNTAFWTLDTGIRKGMKFDEVINGPRPTHADVRTHIAWSQGKYPGGFRYVSELVRKLETRNDLKNLPSAHAILHTPPKTRPSSANGTNQGPALQIKTY